MQWIQYIIIILVIGAPVLGRALQALDKKQKQRQAAKEASTRRHEALRTGQITSTPIKTQVSAGAATQTPTQKPRTAAERMQELARKRQLQLEELRRRQQIARQQQAARQQASRGTPRSAPTQPGRQPTPTTPTVRTTPHHPHHLHPHPQPTRGRQSHQPPTITSRRPAPRLIPKPPRHVPLRESMHTDETHDLSTASASRTVTPITLMGKTMTAADWRRFIIARELLDLPLALRRPDEGQLL
ncbi:Polyhydroxyalkanoic acid synthase [hydrothermal vent metagenome]|uniref:Polyhydroxyalkanoic acid synthase n=1 Tax=hydrothermal vent metagenome TaxID=652676 RepID=A0A3B1E7Z3_9ZZZZ